MTGDTAGTASRHARSPARAVELNLASHAADLHPLVAGATVFRIGDFQIADSGQDHDTFNTITRIGWLSGYAPSDVEAVGRYASATRRPFSWWVADDAALIDAAGVLRDHGFEEGETEENMLLDLHAAVVPAGPGPAAVSRIRTDEDLSAYADVLAANWAPPAVAVSRFLTAAGAGRSWQHEGASRYYLARVDGAPVAGVEAHIAAGVAGVYGVATREEWHGRGIASQLMATVLSDLKDTGPRWAALQATAAGSGIYRRFGFQPVGTCTEFSFGSAEARRSGDERARASEIGDGMSSAVRMPPASR